MNLGKKITKSMHTQQILHNKTISINNLINIITKLLPILILILLKIAASN